jgi:hypothetical protein
MCSFQHVSCVLFNTAVSLSITTTDISSTIITLFRPWFCLFDEILWCCSFLYDQSAILMCNSVWHPHRSVKKNYLCVGDECWVTLALMRRASVPTTIHVYPRCTTLWVNEQRLNKYTLNRALARAFLAPLSCSDEVRKLFALKWLMSVVF